MKTKSAQQLILKSIKEKTIVKHTIAQKSLAVFAELKSILQELQVELQEKIKKVHSEILVEYKDKGKFEAEFKIADDVLIFLMHSDIFGFDNEHDVWKTSYIQQDHSRSFCGMICIYNFLGSSFKYNRGNDIGYLIARIFLNKELHYFVEGKRQLGFLYNNFDHAIFNRKAIKSVVESAILYSLDFDLFTPPYDDMKQLSVSEIIEASANVQIATGKRLGFRFQADDDKMV